MGLKTTNYFIKDLGLLLPEAYALIKDINVSGNYGQATFITQSSRENAEQVLDGGKMRALETTTIDFIVNRNENDRVTAYHKAKELIQETIVLPNGEFDTIWINGPFTGWEDDLIEE